MENPSEEISTIIHTLTQAPPLKQKQAVLQYFVPNAAFTHPFCATSSWEFDLLGLHLDSRWAIIQIYQWYKILSPRIDLEVTSVTLNKDKLKLYVDIHQHFRLWLIPYYDADVRLTTVLQLVQGNELGPSSALQQNSRIGSEFEPVLEAPYAYAANTVLSQSVNGSKSQILYYIASQDDLYQTSEWIRFLIPWGIGSTLVVLWQLYATFLCAVGALVFFPATWWKERSLIEFPRKI